jgi:hypothetical protein
MVFQKRKSLLFCRSLERSHDPQAKATQIWEMIGIISPQKKQKKTPPPSQKIPIHS